MFALSKITVDQNPINPANSLKKKENEEVNQSAYSVLAGVSSVKTVFNLFINIGINSKNIPVIFDYFLDEKRIINLIRISYLGSCFDLAAEWQLLSLQKKALLTIGIASVERFGNVLGRFGVSLLGVPINTIEAELIKLENLWASQYPKKDNKDADNWILVDSDFVDFDLADSDFKDSPFLQIIHHEMHKRHDGLSQSHSNRVIPGNVLTDWNDDFFCDENNFIAISDIIASAIFEIIFQISKEKQIGMMDCAIEILEEDCPALQPIIEIIKNVLMTLNEIKKTPYQSNEQFSSICIHYLFEKIKTFNLIDLNCLSFLDKILQYFPNLAVEELKHSEEEREKLLLMIMEKIELKIKDIQRDYERFVGEFDQKFSRQYLLQQGFPVNLKYNNCVKAIETLGTLLKLIGDCKSDLFLRTSLYFNN